VNQDFLLPATPANARRLLLFRRVTPIELLVSLEELAAQDRLDPAAFDWVGGGSLTRTVAQFLIDCDLRGVVQADYHPEITPLCVLHTVRLKHAAPVVVISERRHTWSIACTAVRVNAQIASTLHALDDTSRDTLVIYDTNYGPTLNLSNRVREVMREFPRFIVYDQQRGFDRLVHWTLWARWLCPSMPHPLYPRGIVDVPEAWKKLRLADFAAFYNVCLFPHLITEPRIVAALEDDYVVEQLKLHSSLFTLT
jgi:hypothetical protein